MGAAATSRRSPRRDPVAPATTSRARHAPPRSPRAARRRAGRARPSTGRARSPPRRRERRARSPWPWWSPDSPCAHRGPSEPGRDEAAPLGGRSGAASARRRARFSSGAAGLVLDRLRGLAALLGGLLRGPPGGLADVLSALAGRLLDVGDGGARRLLQVVSHLLAGVGQLLLERLSLLD